MKPQILIDDPRGLHNRNPATADRVIRGNTYKDLRTIMLVVTRGMIPSRVVQSWLNLSPPMNQGFLRMFMENFEVGDGYNAAIESILAHPELKNWPYIICCEEDNAPPPDGLLKLHESIGKYDVVGGLYWLKGAGGYPQCYGRPNSIPKNFAPFMPDVDSVTECNGVGMGFTLFKTSIFKKLSKPYFKTLQGMAANGGMQASTQDLAFCSKAALEIGARFAIDSRVKVGHWSQQEQIMW